MAVSKVVLNDTTLMDVTQKTVTANSMLNGTTALKNDGTDITGNIATKTSTSGTTGILRFLVTSGLSSTPFFMSSCVIMTITISSFRIPFTARDLSRG